MCLRAFSCADPSLWNTLPYPLLWLTRTPPLVLSWIFSSPGSPSSSTDQVKSCQCSPDSLFFFFFEQLILPFKSKGLPRCQLLLNFLVYVLFPVTCVQSLAFSQASMRNPLIWKMLTEYTEDSEELWSTWPLASFQLLSLPSFLPSLILKYFPLISHRNWTFFSVRPEACPLPWSCGVSWLQTEESLLLPK